MVEERRKEDTEWKSKIEASIKTLSSNQDEIKNTLDKNNEMTETLLAIFDGMQGFWRFCTKTSKVVVWLAKKGTVIGGAIVVFYHALDALLSHDILAAIRTWRLK